MGGLWAIVDAESADEITRKYPVLKVIEERPSWMTAELYEKLVSRRFALADEPPEWLRVAMDNYRESHSSN